MSYLSVSLRLVCRRMGGPAGFLGLLGANSTNPGFEECLRATVSPTAAHVTTERNFPEPAPITNSQTSRMETQACLSTPSETGTRPIKGLARIFPVRDFSLSYPDACGPQTPSTSARSSPVSDSLCLSQLPFFRGLAGCPLPKVGPYVHIGTSCSVDSICPASPGS